MLRFLGVFFLCGFVVGCAGGEYNAASEAPAYSPADMPEIALMDASESTRQTYSGKAAEDETVAGNLAGENRKIIYTASLSIVVDNFGPVEQSISDLVKQHGGFIASANVSLDQGSERSGTWVVRIPVATFEAFLDASGDMGVPERRQQNGQDVTEEYVDLEARIRSKKKLEERILELLAANRGEIKDVIEVERELSRVRTEVEQMEGRLRYLADRTELTTVTLTIREQQNYTPPQAPGLGTQITNTFGDSTNAIGNVAKNLLLVIVACTPWLVLGAAFVVPIWMWRRRSVSPTM